MAREPMDTNTQGHTNKRVTFNALVIQFKALPEHIIVKRK